MELELPSEPTPTSAGFVRRTGAFLLREFREILLPTIFFFVGLTPETLAIKDVNSPAEQDAHTKALLAALHKDAGGSALVVEHCNLISDISDIIAALAGPRLPVVCDPVFDHCYCSKQRENPTHQFALWGTKPVCGTGLQVTPAIRSNLGAPITETGRPGIGTILLRSYLVQQIL